MTGTPAVTLRITRLEWRAREALVKVRNRAPRYLQQRTVDALLSAGFIVWREGAPHDNVPAYFRLTAEGEAALEEQQLRTQKLRSFWLLQPVQVLTWDDAVTPSRACWCDGIVIGRRSRPERLVVLLEDGTQLRLMAVQVRPKSE